MTKPTPYGVGFLLRLDKLSVGRGLAPAVVKCDAAEGCYSFEYSVSNSHCLGLFAIYSAISA